MRCSVVFGSPVRSTRSTRVSGWLLPAHDSSTAKTRSATAGAPSPPGWRTTATLSHRALMKAKRLTSSDTFSAMAANRHEPVPLVEAKVTIPVVSERLLARPRLEEELARLVDEHRVVGVWATAGAGKTT